MSQAQRRRSVTRRYTEPPGRVADAEFHMWPPLTQKCPVCHHPVDSATAPVHPTCEASAGKPASTPNLTLKGIR